ncbi:hypothetical protein FisN_33Lh052 [Fistulifera solaris]|uniref:Uncharacterized protein n=1 Tax=Fistulifera solaris TaxID=1519565 RepID=A0A1Z5KA71_FISSO|nr:hypothetical protein FisN_33Lh052 [Fistulifera solaris]|eukprot:GAX23159.1 hypothetical protein FisN_33Lh052 [Fistulifera solaris]
MGVALMERHSYNEALETFNQGLSVLQRKLTLSKAEIEHMLYRASLHVGDDSSEDDEDLSFYGGDYSCTRETSIAIYNQHGQDMNVSPSQAGKRPDVCLFYYKQIEVMKAKDIQLLSISLLHNQSQACHCVANTGEEIVKQRDSPVRPRPLISSFTGKQHVPAPSFLCYNPAA